MQAEHLQGWLAAAMRHHNLAPVHWERVMELFQTAFRDETLPSECVWQTVVLLPKGYVDYRGIVLVEVLLKSMPLIINRRIGAVVRYHNALHAFRVGQVVGTASLKAKLLYKLKLIR